MLVRGGGDIATGIAHRLHRSGFAVAVTELARPIMVRRSVAFAQAVFDGQITVEGVTAQAAAPDEARAVMARGKVPVIIDARADCVNLLKPGIVVDAILAKYNTGTHCGQARTVIGVGPGFTAGVDVHAVVETMRGHHLGRVYYTGAAIADTGIPGEIAGYTIERLLRAPASGAFSACRQIGDAVTAGEVVGEVTGIQVTALVPGIIRGLIHEGIVVEKGMKIGDIDPRCRREHCFTISDKARAVAGGVLEAVLHRSKLV